MLTGKVINSSATLNDFHEIASIEFLSGESKTFKFILFNTQLNIRYVPASGATINVVFNNSDGTQLTKAGSLNTDDRSIVTVSLSTSETEDLIGGNVSFTLTESGTISKGLMPNSLSKVIEGAC
jgi:hypothetical protein